MQGFKKEKGGVTITVAPWSEVITLTETATGKVLKALPFSNHINAVYFAKKLATK